MHGIQKKHTCLYRFRKEKKTSKYSPSTSPIFVGDWSQSKFIRLQRGLKGPALPEAVVVHDDHLLSVAPRL